MPEIQISQMVIDEFTMNVIFSMYHLGGGEGGNFIPYQALVLEGIVNAPEEKPERPIL